MLRLAIKNYIINIPYAILLVLQMIIVLYAVNNTLIEMIHENKVLGNITFEENLFFIDGNGQTGKRFIEDVTKIVGENCVGYMYKNGEVTVDEKDVICTPPLEYLNTTMEKIHYVLKEGQWFSDKENEVIIGGEIAQEYHSGDEITLKKDKKEKKVIVVGILREPGKVVHLTGSDGENLFSSMNQGKSVMLTNSKQLLAWTGKESSVEADKLVVDVENQDCLQILKKKYRVTSLEKAKSNGKKEIIKNTVGNILYMSILVGIALFSVCIQIYIYLRRNKEEYQIYRMLGLGRIGILQIWCMQHIINLGIVMIILYILLHLTGTMGESNSILTAFMLFHIIYCLLYFVITIFVCEVALKELEEKNKL